MLPYHSIEEFFSSEVTTLVSDAPEWKLERVNRASSTTTGCVVQPTATIQTGNVQNTLVPILSPSPITPVSNTTWSPLSVEDNTKKTGAVAKSRAEAILEKSRQSQTSVNNTQAISGSGTTDVLDKAKAWDLEIWSLSKLFSWLEKFKSRTRLPIKREGISSNIKINNTVQHPSNVNTPGDGHGVVSRRRDNTYFTRGYATSVNLHSRSLSVDSGIEETCETKWINSPYLKFEQIDHLHRPVYAEFRKFPRLYFYGKACTSPFYSAPHPISATAGVCANANKNVSIAPNTQLTQAAASVNRQKSGLRRMFRDTTRLNKQNPKNINSVHPGKVVEEGYQKPDAYGDSTYIKHCPNPIKGKEKERGVVHGRGQKLGYCEVCQVNFYDLLQHINSEVHKEKVSVEGTWEDLDDCMSMTNSYMQAPNEELECSV